METRSKFQFTRPRRPETMSISEDTRPHSPHREGGLPARKNNRFRKKDDSENMGIPVMPHPGTDTQASPYQSRQTKETTNK